LFGKAGASGKGGNFVETMISLAKKEVPLKIIANQYMAPTHTLDIARAIYQAFSYYGREYDFRFSFDSEQSLVCTEFVAKSFTLGGGKGLRFPYVKKLGKYGVTADSMVETLATHCY